MYYDILFLVALVITGASQIFINVTYKNYSKIKCKKGLSGFEVADKILKENGVNNVYIVETKGFLTDHFDPSKKVIRLSSANFHGESVAAAAVAAHEVGHVIQHKEGNTLIKIRSFLAPFASFCSMIGYVVIILGVIFGLLNLFYLGILLLLVILIFQLVTLPVEIDASKKAMANLEKMNLLENDELDSAKSVLTAAALTYVASLATTVLEVLRLFLSARD